MTLKQIVRAIERDAQRQQREAERGRQQQQRQYEQQQRQYERDHHRWQQATQAQAGEAAQSQYIRSLVTLHMSGLDPFDWVRLANSDPPPPPTPSDSTEQFAMRKLAEHKPELFDQILGRTEKIRGKLAAQVDQARSEDKRMFEQACRDYAAQHEEWLNATTTAKRIMGRDPSAYIEAVTAFEMLSVYQNMSAAVTIAHMTPDAIIYGGSFPSRLIPTQTVAWTPSGAPTQRNLRASEFWSIYQNMLCSAALRLVRDTFAILPVSRVIVNLGETALNTSTGHVTHSTYLAVEFSPHTFGAINIYAVDPADAMKNFQHRMRFKKSSGLEPVEDIGLDDGWVTT